MKKTSSFLLLVICFFPSISHADITTGLVGYWKFDETNSGICSGASILDSSGNGNVGTCNNGSTWIAGEIGLGAMSFNGTDQYVSTNFTGYSFSSGVLTVSAWVYPTSFSSTDSIIKNWGQTVFGAFHFDLANQKATLYVSQSNSSVIGPSQSAVVLTANVWTQVVGVADGSFIKVYVNGVQSGTPVSYNGTLNTSFLCTYIGLKANDTCSGASAQPNWFSGIIDDVRVYNRALAQSDITQLYNYGRNTGVATIGKAVIRNAIIN